MRNCLRATVWMLAVTVLCGTTSAANLFTDPYDGSDIQDSVGQTGSESPLGYDTGGGAGAPTITEAGGILTLDPSAFSGFVEFSPQHNFNTADIESAGGFTVELNDVHPNTAGPGTQGSWVGATLFEGVGGDGNVLSSVYSFLLRDNGESVVLANFGLPGQIFTAVPNAGNAGGAHDIRLEVSLNSFANPADATIDAYVDGVLEQTTVLTGGNFDLSNNHVWVRAVDYVSELGELSVTTVPEPASAMLMLLGLGWTAVSLRRSRRGA